MSPRTRNSRCRVLGIDPGIARLGYGIVTDTQGTLALEAFGVIETPAALPAGDRLRRIHRALSDLIAMHRPERVAVEKLFFTKNTATAMVVGAARGVVLLTAAEHHLPVKEFTPTAVKQSITSYGKADKRQIQQILKVLFRLPQPPKPDDAADAIALAVCGTSRFPVV